VTMFNDQVLYIRLLRSIYHSKRNKFKFEKKKLRRN